MARPTGRQLRSEIVETTTVLIQERGVSGFSFGDVAGQLAVKPPSIHHHFRTKDDLVVEVVSAYTRRFNGLVEDIPDGSARARILSYADLFARVASSDRLCLCASVSSDWLAVGERTKSDVQQFFAEQQGWLEAEICAGTSAGEFGSERPPAELALLVLSALEGALLVGRASADQATAIKRVARLLVEILEK